MGWAMPDPFVITSYSIHYTKLYETTVVFSSVKSSSTARMRNGCTATPARRVVGKLKWLAPEGAVDPGLPQELRGGE